MCNHQESSTVSGCPAGTASTANTVYYEQGYGLTEPPCYKRKCDGCSYRHTCANYQPSGYNITWTSDGSSGTTIKF